MDKPTLICTVGLPRSGKSTWARQQKAPIVSPDAIRLELYGQRYWKPGEKMVWATAELMVRSLFTAGAELVILDATCTTRWQRDQWLSDKWDTFFKVFDTDAVTCCFRAGESGMPDLVRVIEIMEESFEYLSYDEKEWDYQGPIGVAWAG